MSRHQTLEESSDPIRPWYEAIGSLGDYVMIRFGHVKPGSSEVEWVSVPHSRYDGIGGFGHLLRKHGVMIGCLPENRHLPEPSWKPFIRSIPKLLGPRHRLEWKELEIGTPLEPGGLPDPVLAWHVFTEEETNHLLARARKEKVTVNTFLLKHLDGVLREDQVAPEANVPWMVPVNLRGKVTRACDTQNHSSYLSVKVSPQETLQDLHAEIYRKIQVGEPWANWKAYSATKIIPQFMKRAMIRSGRAMAEWNLGLFTNLGVWDAEKKIEEDYFIGDWMVAATVLRCQTVGAGVMTFQGRMSLTIQVHPDLSTAQSVPDRWMKKWLKALEIRT